MRMRRLWVLLGLPRLRVVWLEEAALEEGEGARMGKQGRRVLVGRGRYMICIGRVRSLMRMCTRIRIGDLDNNKGMDIRFLMRMVVEDTLARLLGLVLLVVLLKRSFRAHPRRTITPQPTHPYEVDRPSHI